MRDRTLGPKTDFPLLLRDGYIKVRTGLVDHLTLPCEDTGNIEWVFIDGFVTVGIGLWTPAVD